MSAMVAQQQRDIVIIGGGIIGVLTAYYLTRHPSFSSAQTRITILEATGIASGASGKAGGLLARWAYPACIVPLSFQLHADLAKEHGGAERWGYRRVTAGSVTCRVTAAQQKAREMRSTRTARVSGRDVHGYEAVREQGEEVMDKGVETGKDRAAGDGDEWQGLEKVKNGKSTKRRGDVGLPDDLDWLDETTVQSYYEMGSQAQTAQVHPYKFTNAIAELAVAAGVQIIYGYANAIDSDLKGGRPSSVSYTTRDTNEEARLPASDVIITAGPWTSTVLPEAPISAVRAHSIVLEKVVSPYAVFTDIELPKDKEARSKGKKQRHGNIVTPEMYARPDGTIYACGEADSIVPLPRTTANVEIDTSRCTELHTYLSLIVPSLANAPILANQACYLPLLPDGEGPMIGKMKREGVCVAAGHTCWGIQNSCGTGKVLSEIVMEGRARSANIDALDPKNWGV